MRCCPPPRGYETLFGERAARADARRYRRRGLDDVAARMIEFLRRRGLDGATILDVGGGVGAVVAEALRAGASRAVNVELSPYYEAAARELWREEAVADRADYVVADLAVDGRDVGPADAVVLHRVVCCYPDSEALLAAACRRARRHVLLSFPRERVLVRTGVAVVNLAGRALRWEYRAYVHPPHELRAAVERHGFRLVEEHRGRVWEDVAFERTSEADGGRAGRERTQAPVR